MPRKKTPRRRNKPSAAVVVPLDTTPAPLARPGNDTESEPRCSFCGRNAAAFTAAVRGREGIICDSCLSRARAMVGNTPNGVP